MNQKRYKVNKNDTNKKLDKKIFKRISDKFHEYWKCLFRLIGIYIVAYLFWFFIIVKHGKRLTNKYKLNGNVLWFTIIMILIQGLLFSLDGFVTALLKSPFNQMCFAVNKTEGISDKKKDFIITKATESNEHCKETLKKFGIITIATELFKSFIKSQKEEKGTDWEELMVLSYLVPICFAAFDIWLIYQELQKMKRSISY
ncbi:hypothetical protein [endosymbiont GvMRE of Glomus versiforme]|uniref:hypothetical protein n=1 Tax=endosymbiont GvMRE of Glomus versiforme TaxID=2039283 RepID=UPI000EEF5B1A|nr:hypothetical protein [endosymbiont GvMRE of Glomus versiforme]RHZ35489.1 hypothetical protein GvMRE_IIg355 [endosymbiont GvMRE of Glomus versiforme]